MTFHAEFSLKFRLKLSSTSGKRWPRLYFCYLVSNDHRIILAYLVLCMFLVIKCTAVKVRVPVRAAEKSTTPTPKAYKKNKHSSNIKIKTDNRFDFNFLKTE